MNCLAFIRFCCNSDVVFTCRCHRLLYAPLHEFAVCTDRGKEVKVNVMISIALSLNCDQKGNQRHCLYQSYRNNRCFLCKSKLLAVRGISSLYKPSKHRSGMSVSACPNRNTGRDLNTSTSRPIFSGNSAYQNFTFHSFKNVMLFQNITQLINAETIAFHQRLATGFIAFRILKSC